MSTEFSLFWETYPKDLCNRPGSRQEAEKSWNKIGSDIQAQIIVNMRELMRVDRKVRKTGAGRPEWVWPMATTWLNQARWQDIESIKQTADMPTDARECDCGNIAAHKGKCWACYDENNPANDLRMANLKDIFIKNGLLHEETRAERTERCKDFLRQRGYLGTVIPDRA
jgi:hypothetical protein